MRRGSILVVAAGLALSGGRVIPPAGAGTFTMLNQGDPHPSWGVSRINNLGHVAMTRATTSAYSGPAYLWTGSWATLALFTGSSVGNAIFQPQLELNDHDRIAYRTGSDGVRVAGLSGVITLGAAPTSLNYTIDINDNNRIAVYSWAATSQNRIYTSDDPYTSYAQDVGPADILINHVSYNDNAQIAWRPSGTTKNIYRFTPGVGNELIGSSDFSPFDMDDAGRVIHLRTRNSVMLNDLRLRFSTAVWQSTSQYSQPRISDNGRHVVWTEYDGAQWNLWTLEDGIPIDLTQGAYDNVLSPDVNDAGTVVFASARNMWVSPYASDVYLYTPDDPGPIVYNGHFDGETWFGWSPSVGGAAHVDLVAASGGGFAAQLTSGSPATIEQAIDVPADPATLSFAFDFLSIGGTLTVSLGGVELAQLAPADDIEAGFTHREIVIAATPPLGQSGATLSFALDGPAASVVQLDSIRVEPVTATGVREGPPRPAAMALGIAQPNPFRTGTAIPFDLRQAGSVRVEAFDARGRRVSVLLDGWRGAGAGAFTWDGAGANGEPLAPGTYFLRARSGDTVQTRKVVLLR